MENVARVACVDDDPDMLAWMETVLSGLGAQALAFQDSRRALEEIRRRPPSLILMDVAMPSLDGYQLCEALREDPRTARIPVVFLTSLAGEWERSRAFLLGAVDYLTKPIGDEALIRAVNAHLETARVFEEVMRLVDAPWDAPFQAAGFARFKAHVARRRGMSRELARVFEGLHPEALFSGANALGVTERALTQAMSDFFPAPYLPQIRPADVRVGILPTSFCLDHRVLPVGEAGDRPTFVVANPFDSRVLDAVRRASRGRDPWISLAQPSSFDVLRDWSFRRPRSLADSLRSASACL